MYGFSETAAVHFRIEDDQKQSKDGEESLKDEGGDGSQTPPYACDKGCSDGCFQKCNQNSSRFGCKVHEAYVEELKIFLQHKTGADRVHQLEDAPYEKYKTSYEAAETLHSQ